MNFASRSHAIIIIVCHFVLVHCWPNYDIWGMVHVNIASFWRREICDIFCVAHIFLMKIIFLFSKIGSQGENIFCGMKPMLYSHDNFAPVSREHCICWCCIEIIQTQKKPSNALQRPPGESGLPLSLKIMQGSPQKKIPQLPESIFPLLPKSLKSIQLLPKPPNI